MMKNLYFQRSDGTYLLIQENVEEKEVFGIVTDFLRRHNYYAYYFRYWTKNEKTIYDVGSWSEFFVLAAADKIPQDKIVGTEKDFIEKKNDTI